MNLYITHLRADTVLGVHVVDPVDYPDAEWHYCVQDFLDSLKTLDDSALYLATAKQLFFSANPDDLGKIEAEYGVHRV